jgi:hypothetical protein
MYHSPQTKPGRDCGHELITVYLTESTSELPVIYCRDSTCANYYICGCGVEFGKHFPLTPINYEQRNKKIQRGNKKA